MMAAKVAVVSEAREGEQGASEAAPGGGLFVVWSHGLTNCTMYTVQAVSGNRTHSQTRRERRNIALTKRKILRLLPGFELRVSQEILATTWGMRMSGIEPGTFYHPLKTPLFTSAS